ncbi:hypothetical protein, partial [Neisseria dumasiana]
MFHDWVYFSSYVVALVLFLIFNSYIDDRLAGESRLVATTVFLTIISLVIFALHEWHDEKEWEVFRQRNRCEVMDK